MSDKWPHPDPPFRITEIMSAVGTVMKMPVDDIIELRHNGKRSPEAYHVMIGCLRDLTHPQRTWVEVATLVNRRSHFPVQKRYYKLWLGMSEPKRLALVRRVRNTILQRRRNHSVIARMKKAAQPAHETQRLCRAARRQ